ncbi:bifunctional riboflavin kinase/FAD synthetase [Georgenia sp. Z1491]|uniref:bifunctional riboflavin kinase/FAD synthetase n=1 Tax=Georgenia sp. Z1491 TaxID=3416707 RepID=UPI003CED8066
MQVWHDSEEIPRDLGPIVLTVGVFDGVHRGHRALLAATVEEAAKRSLPAVALTFDPHPAQVHRPEDDLVLVANAADRIERLSALGLDGVLVQHYDLEFASATPEEFVSDYLRRDLEVACLVVGEDVRFGRDNAGDADVLHDLCDRLGIELVLVAEVACDLTGRRWSSTWIRQSLAAGDVHQAARILGRPHRLRGVVVRGFRRGRALGYPTANLAPDDLGVVPADGVYAGWLLPGPFDTPGAADTGATRLPAAISVGTNPTFQGTERTVEAHVLGRTDLDLYDEEVVVEFVAHLRPMVTFDGMEPLMAQMRADVEDAAGILGVPVPPELAPDAVTAT